MGALNFPTIDQAISTFEGFGTSGAPTITAANNPGAIQAGLFATSQGSTSSTPGGFAIFKDQASGLAAVDALVTRYAKEGATIQDLIGHWAPANAPGNTAASTQNYTNSVANAAGAPANTPLSQLQEGQKRIQDIVDQLTGTSGNTPEQAALQGSKPPKASDCGTFDIFCQLQAHGVTVGRVIAIVLGLVLIAGGILAFSFTQFDNPTVQAVAGKAAIL